MDVSLDFNHSPKCLSPNIVAVTLAVNELATNAIKHAFRERKTGYIRASLSHSNPGRGK